MATDPLFPPPVYPAASAGNMALLIQLRWMAVVGQLITIWFASRMLGIALPLLPLAAISALLALVNGVTMVMARGRTGYSYLELIGALMLDAIALTWQLYLSGGTTNPFTFLFLLQIVIGAILLPTRRSWIIAGVAVLSVTLLSFAFVPLGLPP